MISWIQHHLIRHGRWIFLSLLAVIIVAFVFTIGNTPGCTTDRSSYRENLFYGIDMNSPLERDQLVQKMYLSVTLNNQRIRSDQQAAEQLQNRIALLHLADQIGVPYPTEAALAEYIKTKNAFRGPDGEFSPDTYISMVDQLESNPRAPKGLVKVVLEEDFRIDQLTEVIAGPGYILPSEASAQARQSRTVLELATAEISYAEFEPEITPEESTLKEYYESNKQRYEIPERIQASYILFESQNFVDQVSEASDTQLREHFAANRADFVEEYEAANPNPEPTESESGDEATTEPTEPVTFEKVREAVARSFAGEQAKLAANEAAQAFAYQLYRDSVALDSAAFNQLLNKNNLSLTEIEPYTRVGARQRAISPEMLESAFSLTEKRYYSDAYEVDEGFAVLIYKGKIPPVIPPYEEVAAEVASDYKREEKRRLFNEKGESLKATLEAALSEGTSFTEAAESNGLKTNTYDSFEVKDAPSELNRSALQQAQSLDEGSLSPMLNLRGMGTFVYVKSKQVPELSDEDPDLAQTRSMLQRWASFTTGTDITNELVFRGLPEDATVTDE